MVWRTGVLGGRLEAVDGTGRADPYATLVSRKRWNRIGKPIDDFIARLGKDLQCRILVLTVVEWSRGQLTILYTSATSDR